jgi:hypothetical protein
MFNLRSELGASLAIRWKNWIEAPPPPPPPPPPPMPPGRYAHVTFSESFIVRPRPVF